MYKYLTNKKFVMNSYKVIYVNNKHKYLPATNIVDVVLNSHFLGSHHELIQDRLGSQQAAIARLIKGITHPKNTKYG